jgi:outer membrane lipase/esterase
MTNLPDNTARPTGRHATRWIIGLCAAVATLALNGCGGGGTVHEPFVPTKIIAMGDNLAVITSPRYTVNVSTGEIMTSVEQLAATYGLSAALTSSASVNAKVAASTSFASAAVPLTTQVSNYSASIGTKDMFVLSAGTVDIIDEFKNGTKSTAVITNAATNYVTAVQALIGRGAKRILVVSPYDLSITPWGKSLISTDQAILQTMVTTFRDQLKAKLALAGVDGRIVVYVDQELEMNYIVNNNSLVLTDLVTPVCSTAANDPSNGIGLGTGELNSSLCTGSTLITVSAVTADLAKYAFADKIYPTPVVNRDLGTIMYNATSSR